MRFVYLLPTMFPAALGIAVAEHSIDSEDTPDHVPGVECSPIVERRNVALIETWISNLAAGPGANDELKAPDMTATLPASLPYGGTIPVADYEAALAARWLPPAEPSDIAPELTASCDRVFLDADFNLTAISTGIEVDVPVIEVFTIEDGLVADFTPYYFDTQVLVDALGE